MKHQTIEEAILGHEGRNEALRRVFQEKRVDLSETRSIECHFWAPDRDNAAALAAGLSNRGFKILVQVPAVRKVDFDRRNVEAEIRQSIDLTMRREFIEELVRLAYSHNSTFDGWGTLI
jgi:regulator of RNase E activity RraB